MVQNKNNKRFDTIPNSNKMMIWINGWNERPHLKLNTYWYHFVFVLRESHKRNKRRKMLASVICFCKTFCNYRTSGWFRWWKTYKNRCVMEIKLVRFKMMKFIFLVVATVVWIQQVQAEGEASSRNIVSTFSKQPTQSVKYISVIACFLYSF